MEQISQRTNILRVWIAISTLPVFDCGNMYSELLREVFLRNTVLFTQLAQPKTKRAFLFHGFTPGYYDKIREE